MLRTLSFLGLVGAAALFVNATASTSPTGDSPQSCPNVLAHEPALIYDVTGSTLLGPVHMHMTVYQDGFVTISSKTEDPFEGTSDVNVVTANASPQDVSALVSELYFSGAYELCDQTTAASDIPLTTITVFRGSTNAKAHTFSYWLGDGEYSKVEAGVSGFLARYFPN